MRPKSPREELYLKDYRRTHRFLGKAFAVGVLLLAIGFVIGLAVG
jgi:hypothetical protein